MDFYLIFGIVMILIVLAALLFLIVKGFMILLYVVSVLTMLFGFTLLLQGLEGLAIGIGLIFNGGLLLVIANLMDAVKQHEKKITFLMQAVQPIQEEMIDKR
jgi:hypothetical protein